MPKKKIPCLETFLRFSVPNAALTAGNACASEWKWQRQTTSEGDRPTTDRRQTADGRRQPTTDGQQTVDRWKTSCAREHRTERNGARDCRGWGDGKMKMGKAIDDHEVIVAAVCCCCRGCCCAIGFAWAAHGAYACCVLRCVALRIRPVDTNLWQ